MTYITTIDKAIPFHPFAKKFPSLDSAEFKALEADIKANGLREPIITLYQGQILDGIHRYRACLRLKIEPQFKEFEGDDAAAAAFVVSRNVHRRHLKPKEKSEAIAALLKADPNKSDRQIAAIVKASPTTVGTKRAKMEAAGDVSKLDTRTDTKGRKQSAKKATGKASAEQARLKAVKGAMKEGERKKQEYTQETIISELGLLREFARFVIGRARVTTDLPDHAEWKTLLGKVKATLGIVS
jgi:ParB-like chromosome segregation protein Spo0J